MSEEGEKEVVVTEVLIEDQGFEKFEKGEAFAIIESASDGVGEKNVS